MAERIYLQLFHSNTPGAVPNGLKIGEIGLNVADGLQFYGYGGDINYDVNGNPLPDLPPLGQGWKAIGIGGDGPPGPPGPSGQGVPEGGTTGQYLRKATDGDYVTEWDDGPTSATSTSAGLLFGRSDNVFGNENVSLGYGSLGNLTTGERNVAVGFQSGLNVDPSYDSVLIGYQAGFNIDGNQNVIIGSGACGVNPGGAATGNVVLGYQAAINATAANYNVLVGYKAGYNIRSGDNNTIIGAYAGSSDLQGNVVLADGIGNVRFQANEFGAWSANGGYGSNGQILMSQGSTLPPRWMAAPDTGVTQVVAGGGIVVSPSSGTGVVTVSFDGDPDAGVQSITRGNGITFRNGAGQIVTSITSTGTVEINDTQVLTPDLYTQAGSILLGGYSGLTATGVVSLVPGNPGQVLGISGSGFPAWQDVAPVAPATPSTLGTVFALTGGGANPNVALGLGAGSAITGSALGNTFIGPAAGSQVNTGDYNTFVGGYTGTGNISNNVVLADGQGNIKLQLNENGALSVDGTNYGTSGYVLSSNGSGQPPQWIDPPSAPIQTITEGSGISVTQIGTAVEISNTGVTSIVATSPLQVSDDTGAITISAPNLISDLTQGTGILVTGTGNSRTIANTGVVTLQNGTNTTAVQVSPGVWKVNADPNPDAITTLLEGAGIDILSPSGPTPTITNTGVISVAASSTVVPSATSGAAITFSVQNVVTAATAGSGISITGTATNPTINNAGVIQLVNGTGTAAVNNGDGTWQINATGTAGVTKIIAGDNVSITPTSGIGEVTINAAGGGGGGSITEITSANADILVASGTGPVVTLTNKALRAIRPGYGISRSGSDPQEPVVSIDERQAASWRTIAAGTGISITEDASNVRTWVNTGVTSLTAGSGISLSGGTGNVTITATSGGTVKEIKSANNYLDVSGGTGPVVTLTNLGVNRINQGTGILVTGNAVNPTISIASSVLTSVTGGNGITVSGTNSTRAIENTGVVSLVNGAGINATKGTNNAWTVVNTGVTKLTAGANITLSGNSGEITISASGGGAGSITGITAGTGLTGGGTTGNVTLGVNTDQVVTMGAFGNSGSIVYRLNPIIGSARFQALDAPATDIGRGYYFLGISADLNGTPVWRTTYCTSLRDGDGTTASPGDPFWTKGEFAVNLNYATISDKYLDYNRFGGVGTMLVGTGTGTVGTSQRAKELRVGIPGQILQVANNLDLYWETPTYNAYNAGSGIDVAVGTRVGTIQNYTISLNTDYLNLNFVPKSAYSATGTLIQGTGVGTFATLPPGSNGQVLTVSSSGTLQWQTPSGGGGGAAISLTSPDDSITITPSPFTQGTGTIVVNSSKYVASSIFTTPGDLVVASGSPAAPARLAAGATVGMVLSVTATTGNDRIGWTNTISGGTY
jgi:hypothetical protein